MWKFISAFHADIWFCVHSSGVLTLDFWMHIVAVSIFHNLTPSSTFWSRNFNHILSLLRVKRDMQNCTLQVCFEHPVCYIFLRMVNLIVFVPSCDLTFGDDECPLCLLYLIHVKPLCLDCALPYWLIWLVCNICFCIPFSFLHALAPWICWALISKKMTFFEFCLAMLLVTTCSLYLMHVSSLCADCILPFDWLDWIGL